MTQLEQFLKTENAQIFSALILREDRLQQSGPIFYVQPRWKFIDPIFQRVAIHSREGLADSGDNKRLLAEHPLHPQSLVRVVDEDILVQHVQISLHVFVVALTEPLQKNHRDLLTRVQIIRTQHPHDLRSNRLVLVTNQLFNELVVDQDQPFVSTQRNLISQVELQQTFNSPQQHREIRTGITTANRWTVLVNPQRRLLIKEIINKMLQKLPTHHVPCRHRTLP